MKINLKESLNKIDLATDNKYDLLNTFNSKKLSDNSKKKLMEAIENKSIASVNKILHESEEQLYKVVLSSGATKFNFESALYKDEAEGIVDYYDGRWIDENGFEWDMYVEEDDDSTEHAMVDIEESLPSRYWEPEDDRTDEEEYQDWLDNGSTPNYDEEPPFECLNEDLSSVEEIKQLDFTNNRVNNLRGIFSTKSFVKALNDVGLDKFKIRTSRLKNISKEDLKDAWYDLKRNGWTMSIERDPSLSGFNEVYVFEKITNESLDEQLTEASYGGAYDIEDDMFFTKEEIVEFANNICEDLAKEFGYKYDIADVYMDSPTKLHIELVDNHDIEVDINVRIDMRRIKKPSDLEKAYHNSALESFKNRFLEEYQYYDFDESLNEQNLKEDLSDLDLFLSTPVDTKQFNDETFRALKNLVSEYKKDLNSLDQWASEGEKEPFVKKWYKLADKCKEIAKNGIRGITGYGRLNDFIKLKIVDLARSVDNTFPWYTRNNLAKYNRLESLQEKLNNREKNVFINEIEKTKSLAEIENIIKDIRVYDLKLYSKLVHYPNDFEKAKNYILKILKNSLKESLTEDTVKQNGKWVNKGKEGTHGKFKTKKAADAQRKAMFANGYKAESLDEQINLPGYAVKWVSGYGGSGVNNSNVKYFRTEKEQKEFADKLNSNNTVGVKTYKMDNFYHTLPKEECLEESNDKDSEDKVAVFTKGIDGKSYYHGFMNRKEADKHYPDRLKESIDDEIDLDFETDFDDGEVEEGNVFFADGTDWVWEERIAGPLYLDFDKWAVWSARESVDIRDFIIGGNANGGWDIDKEAYIEAVKSKPIVYFIVDEDTGFIDWGPVENEIEAKDFLNSKQDDWENDYYEESLKESFDNSTVFEIYYDDIDGEKADYYFEVPYKDVLEFLANYAEDEEDAPQDEEELLKYIDNNFDRLYNEHEYEVLDHFYEDAEMKYQSDKEDRAEYIRDTMRDRDI